MMTKLINCHGKCDELSVTFSFLVLWFGLCYCNRYCILTTLSLGAFLSFSLLIVLTLNNTQVFVRISQFILQYRHPSPVRQATRQCYVLSSAVPGHRPQALLSPSGPITLGPSYPSLRPTPTLSRLSSLHKRQYATSHAVPSPPPEFHFTLSLSTFKWRRLRQRSWTNPRCRAGFAGKCLESDHHTSLAAAVTQMRGAFLFVRIMD